jgi:Ca2+/Na+ antiporter
MEVSMAHAKRPANGRAGGKKPRTKFHEYTAANDMKYKGPLNYQSFQLFGWICIVLAVVAGLINAGASIDPELEKRIGKIGTILSWIASLSLPFLLMANFSKILANKEGYKKQLLRNGGASLAIFVVTIVMGSRYFVGTVEQIVTPKEEVVPLLESFIRRAKPEGFLAFNLFIDLFMCTLSLYFLNARPKRVFTGKRVIILRLFCGLLCIGVSHAEQKLSAHCHKVEYVDNAVFAEVACLPVDKLGIPVGAEPLLQHNDIGNVEVSVGVYVAKGIFGSGIGRGGDSELLH